jgi:hypothetical protein
MLVVNQRFIRAAIALDIPTAPEEQGADEGEKPNGERAMGLSRLQMLARIGDGKVIHAKGSGVCRGRS